MKAIVFLTAMLSATAALADWNGTWVGNWKSGNGTQIVFDRAQDSSNIALIERAHR